MGLYFFEISRMGFKNTRKLLDTWKRLKQKHCKDFEIVFLYKDDHKHISIAKIAFEKELGCPIPWYLLPPDGSSRQLCRLFGLASQWNDITLIILQPDKYQPMSYFAFDILKEYGLASYPFTMESVVTLLKGKQQAGLVLNQLLSSKTLLCRGGYERYKVCEPN